MNVNRSAASSTSTWTVPRTLEKFSRPAYDGKVEGRGVLLCPGRIRPLGDDLTATNDVPDVGADLPPASMERGMAPGLADGRALLVGELQREEERVARAKT